ncbi:MAG: lytic murein transglycosylase B [Rhodospirillaceae bacterium]|nr:lytic murein transglycosylase B [Rhodospirillaceae bacterium]|tara:strand:- start:1072 stop:2082 length:1011 start_codon:yes stop_codon:yes gene_type:complete
MKSFFPYLCLSVFLAQTLNAQSLDVDMDSVYRQRDAFIEEMVLRHNLEKGELARVLNNVNISRPVLEAISRPAEKVMLWRDYRQIFLNETRIQEGVRFWVDHAGMINAVSEEYGVAPEILVSILGIETYYGQRTGTYRVVDSLSTLAFAYPPRSKFFRSELESFFLLVTEEEIDPEIVTGSYAGAMGAGQFISSSYREYAVDGDLDGKRDLWGNWHDILSSVANYFKVHGWRQYEDIVSRASISLLNRPGVESVNSMTLDETILSLKDAGYVFTTQLPAESLATVLSLQGENGEEYWVGYNNFRVITRYNHSVMYALAAYQLAEIIRTQYEQGTTH